MRYLYILLFSLLLTGCNRELKKEIELLREELAKQQQYVPLKKDTIRDTVEVVTQKVIEVERIKEVLSKEDKELLKDLGMKVKELEAYQKTSTIAHDTVFLEKKDSNTLYYKDAWAEFEYKNKKLAYSIKDSLAIAIKREYKHRLLFFKWGTKGYDVKVANFNPHSTIKYNTYLKKK